jgi:Flp pilus assembly protein TadB
MLFIVKYWKLFAAISAVIAIIYSANYLVNTGRDKERIKIAEEINENVKTANEVEDRNRSASDADIFERLRRWQRD